MTLPRPSLSTLLTSCFTTTKASLSSCVASLRASRAESVRIAQDPRNIRKGQELSDFGTFEKEEEFDEFGLSSGDKITDWQAGWNVTNAIQVTLNVTIFSH
jgi:hypothetical protein